MQPSASRFCTCFVRVVTNVKRYKSCCSDGKAWSFETSSSGVDEAGSGGAGTEPFVEGGGLSPDIDKMKLLRVE